MSTDAPRFTRRHKRLALAGSLLFHLAFALVFGSLVKNFFVKPQHDRASVIQTITIARKTPAPHRVAVRPPVAPPPPAPAPPQPTQEPPPPPVAPPHPTVAVVPVHHELSKPVPTNAPPPPEAPPVAAAIETSAPVATHSTTVAMRPPGKPHLSNQQIASIQDDLAKDIAQDKARASDPLGDDRPVVVATPKDYGGSYGSNDDSGGGLGAHGLCDPATSWRPTAGTTIMSSAKCGSRTAGNAARTSRGPCVFRPSADPYKGTLSGTHPIAMPLPGWHPDASTVISPELRAYAANYGRDALVLARVPRAAGAKRSG